MINYKSRPKINSKIIFNNVPKNTKNALVIGENSSDIIEVLKSKKITTSEFTENDEKKILNFLNKHEDNKFELIILNSELCDFQDINTIISTLINKSNYSVIRFRNNNHNKKITKKTLINNIIKQQKISIFKKIFGKQNKISNSIIFKPFAYYTVYFITKNTYAINFVLTPLEKIKSFLNISSEKINLTLGTNKK
ncbi:MAG: hypothetical protein PHY80_01375 [Rickettsiales bacterium]|nr:hypothetical protein [Rickettsiales bacterium]